MKCFILSLMTSLISLSSNAQGPREWTTCTQRIEYKFARALALDEEGNVIVAGGHEPDFASDFLTIKYNPAGGQLWTASFNGPSDGVDGIWSAACDRFNNTYVTGGSDANGGYGHSDFVTIKYDPTGVQQWEARYQGPHNSNDIPSSLAVDESGNVYVTGTSYYGVWVNCDIITVKYNSAGIRQWVAPYNGPGGGDDYWPHLALDGWGNVIVTGRSDMMDNADIVTLKYNSAGDLQWTRFCGGPANGNDEAQAVVTDSAGNIYVTGMSFGQGPMPSSSITVKYDMSGNQLWAAHYDGPDHLGAESYGIAVDGNGNVFVTGDVKVSLAASDFATLKYGPTGELVWIAIWEGPWGMGNVAHAVNVDENGNVYVAGQVGLGEGGIGHLYAHILYDSDGNQQWEEICDGPAGSVTGIPSQSLDKWGNVYITETTWLPQLGYQIETLKYAHVNPRIMVDATPVNPPIIIPANGGSFLFDLAVVDSCQDQHTFMVWTHLQYPNGVYSEPMLGPIIIRPPLNVTLTRRRMQTISANCPPGNYLYIACAAINYFNSQQLLDSSYFAFTKSSTPGGHSFTGEDSCAGDPFPGEFEGMYSVASMLDSGPTLNLTLSPNPFNPSTAIGFELRAASHVSLKVHDIFGRLVATLADGGREAGSHQVTWDASGLPSGMYFCRIQAGEFSAVQKMMLVK